MQMQFPLLPTAVVGVLTLVVALTVNKPLKDYDYNLPPQYQPQFHQKMLRLEFIPDAVALDLLFGKDEDRSNRIEAMRKALGYDYFFILAYTLFFVIFGICAAADSEQKRHWWLVPLGLLPGVADWLENGYTEQLLDLVGKPGAEALIPKMQCWVWVKSLSMAVYLLGIADVLRQHGRLGRWIALVSVPVAICGFASRVRLELFEVFGLFGAILFIILIGYCFIYRRQRSFAPTTV